MIWYDIIYIYIYNIIWYNTRTHAYIYIYIYTYVYTYRISYVYTHILSHSPTLQHRHAQALHFAEVCSAECSHPTHEPYGVGPKVLEEVEIRHVSKCPEKRCETTQSLGRWMFSKKHGGNRKRAVELPGEICRFFWFPFHGSRNFADDIRWGAENVSFGLFEPCSGGDFAAASEWSGLQSLCGPVGLAVLEGHQASDSKFAYIVYT